MVRQAVKHTFRAMSRSLHTLVAGGVLGVIVMLVAAVVISAADTEPASAGEPDPYAHTKYSIIWSDPAGLDLMSPEGTYVRASVESRRVSDDNGDPSVAMPGFWESLNTMPNGVGGAKWRPDGDDPWVGIVGYEILDAVEDGETLHVTVCEYEDQLGMVLHSVNPDLDGRYEYWNGGGGVAWLLTIRRVGPTAPPSRQSGPQTFGKASVFGTWRTTEWRARDTLFEPDPCLGRSTPSIAADTWPPPGTLGDRYHHYTTEIPAAPSYPGWPDAL